MAVMVLSLGRGAVAPFGSCYGCVVRCSYLAQAGLGLRARSLCHISYNAYIVSCLATASYEELTAEQGEEEENDYHRRDENNEY